MLASKLTADILRAAKDTEKQRRQQAKKKADADGGFWTKELKQVRAQLRKAKRRDMRGIERRRLAK